MPIRYVSVELTNIMIMIRYERNCIKYPNVQRFNSIKGLLYPLFKLLMYSFIMLSNVNLQQNHFADAFLKIFE